VETTIHPRKCFSVSFKKVSPNNTDNIFVLILPSLRKAKKYYGELKVPLHRHFCSSENTETLNKLACFFLFFFCLWLDFFFQFRKKWSNIVFLAYFFPWVAKKKINFFVFGKQLAG